MIQRIHEVIRLGYRMASALEPDDLVGFERLERENVRRQTRRDRTWERTGIVCK